MSAIFTRETMLRVLTDLDTLDGENATLTALVAQYRDTHRDQARRSMGQGGDCACGLCDRAEGLGIPPVNQFFEAEDARAELGRTA